MGIVTPRRSGPCTDVSPGVTGTGRGPPMPSVSGGRHGGVVCVESGTGDGSCGGAGTKVDFTWTGAMKASAPGPYDTLLGIYQTVLSTNASYEGVSALVDVKQIDINICADCAAAAPEPGGVALLSASATMLLMRRRRAFFASSVQSRCQGNYGYDSGRFAAPGVGS